MTSIAPISKERGQRKARVAQLFWQNQRFHTLCNEKKSPNYSLKHNYIARIAKSPLNVPQLLLKNITYKQNFQGPGKWSRRQVNFMKID